MWARPTVGSLTHTSKEAKYAISRFILLGEIFMLLQWRFIQERDDYGIVCIMQGI